MPIEIVLDMLGFNMLNPKMKSHPPFVLPRLANMQRSQHTNLLKKKTAFDFLLAWVTLAKTHKSCKCTHLNFVNCNYAYLAVHKDIQRHTMLCCLRQSASSADRRSQVQRQRGGPQNHTTETVPKCTSTTVSHLLIYYFVKRFTAFS